MKEFKCPMCGEMISSVILTQSKTFCVTYLYGDLEYDDLGSSDGDNFKCEECGELIAKSEEQLIDLFKG